MSHNTNTDPRVDSTRRPWRQSAHRPAVRSKVWSSRRDTCARYRVSRAGHGW